MTRDPKPRMRDLRPQLPRTRACGLMLVEAVICVVIVAVMLVAALQTVAAAAKARSIQVNQCQGPALARQLMAEIRQCRYSEESSATATTTTSAPVAVSALPNPLGPDDGEVVGKDRTLFDDVDDYNGLTESPRSRDGLSLKLDNFQWKAAVEYVQPGTPQDVVADDRGVKRITVTVTSPAGTTQLVALRSRYASYDQLPRAKTTYVSAVNVRLRVGEGGRTIQSGTNLANQVGVAP